MDQSRKSVVTLGTTDIKISPLGSGTWAWGDTMVWAYAKGYTDDDIKGAFEVSINGGIKFIDTAEIYGKGRSEEKKLPGIEMLNGIMREIGENYGGKSPAQIALNWTICN